MRVRAHVFFHGRVQGVFFRDFVRRRARLLGVTGWIRNLPDGRVEAVMEGERERIQELISMAVHEHPYARVTKVDVEWSEATGEFDGFSIVG